MSVVLFYFETTATAYLLDPAEKDVTSMTTKDKLPGGTKTAVTGELAVDKKAEMKNVPTMTGTNAGGPSVARPSPEARPQPETDLLHPGGHENDAETQNGTMW